MITDIHCHFIPDEFFRLVQQHPEFRVRIGKSDGEAVDLDCRGANYALNSTFFQPARQIARMETLGIGRTVVSLATPLVDYYIEPDLATRAARLCNDGFAQLIEQNPGRFAAWAYL